MAFVLPGSKRQFAFNRADHVGSFLRPPTVHESRKGFKENTLDAEGLRNVEDTEISSLVEQERAVGIKSISDGEFR
jgi:5-methyltetrahydropteroyltriglutamate--homocysteine methyltransferase